MAVRNRTKATGSQIILVRQNAGSAVEGGDGLVVAGNERRRLQVENVSGEGRREPVEQRNVGGAAERRSVGATTTALCRETLYALRQQRGMK